MRKGLCQPRLRISLGSHDLFRDVRAMTVSLDTLSSPTLHDPASLLDYFTELADPRREQGRFHRLDEIIFISICAVTCGADSWEEIASYAHSKIDWLQTVLTLPGGVPSHDTFRRVFCLLDPLAFQECFYAWMTAVMNRRGLTPVPLDPPELKPVDIAGKIVGGGGQYVLAVKENQPHLYEDIERAFDEALDQGEPGVDFTECQTEGPRKGRQETRTCCVITNPKGIRDAGLWTGLTAIVMVISERVVNGVAGSETRYFIGSVARTAEEYLRWVRGHWGIENSLHWVLDVCFCEDDQRHWAGNSAENLGWLRKLALCLLKAEKSRSSKGKSINTRRLIAGWKNDYLLRREKGSSLIRGG